MVDIITSSNTTLPVGMVSNKNNTDAALAMKTYRAETTGYQPTYTGATNDFSFAQAIYGDGPYNLTHPNSASEILAQNIDLTA